MEQYRPLIIAAAILLLIGASTPSSGDKELIVRLQGEVLVLQRQIRDLQESFDKWQGQSQASLQKISDQSADAARGLSMIGDSLKTANSSQTSGMAGATTQLNRISDQISRQGQSLNGLSQQLVQLGQSVEQFQKRIEAKEKAETRIDGSFFNNNPDGLYAAAYGQYGKGNYEAAIKLFRQYLETYRDSEESDDAIYWIAESLTHTARQSEALNEYNRILAEYPRGDKSLPALLKKGITLLRLERRDEGVSTLKLVISQSPNSQEATLARSELSRLGE